MVAMVDLLTSIVNMILCINYNPHLKLLKTTADGNIILFKIRKNLTSSPSHKDYYNFY